MFASSYPSHAGPRHLRSGLYQQVGVETRLSGASPHQMVAMLFDGFMEAVAQARGAIRAGQSTTKGQAIGRAVRIIEEGLRAGLDLKAGGTLARDLHDLYGYLTMRLTLANLRSDESMLDECQRLVQPLREAWISIGSQADAPR
jgi:flagellar secretion chaperone FliS